jgi:hypothetical protein
VDYVEFVPTACWDCTIQLTAHEGEGVMVDYRSAHPIYLETRLRNRIRHAFRALRRDGFCSGFELMEPSEVGRMIEALWRAKAKAWPRN